MHDGDAVGQWGVSPIDVERELLELLVVERVGVAAEPSRRLVVVGRPLTHG